MRDRQPRGDVSLKRYVTKKVFFFGHTTSLILFEKCSGFLYVPHELISESASSFEKLEE